MRVKISSKRITHASVECVSGILIDDRLVLVEKRRDDDEADPGLVMLPGGHVEKNESLEECLKREMSEELGIHVGAIAPVRVRDYVASNGEGQRIHYFHVKDWTREIESNEAERVYWESDLENLSDLVEREIVSKLLSRR